jgi:HEAT repeat protein
VRQSAAEALGRLGRAEEKVVDGLLALARDAGLDPEVRRSAYQSLKRLVGSVVD